MKDYLKPITEGLFGKQKPYALEEKAKPPVVRPVSMILEDICTFDDAQWMTYAFSREPLNGRFDDTMRQDFMAKALACGREAAEQCIEKYGTNDPTELARRLELAIDYPDMPQSTARVVFAEFQDPNKIFIYMDGVRKGNALLGEPEVRKLLGGIFIHHLLLAHEIFHFVEKQQEKEIWTKTFKVDLWSIKPFKNRSRVATLSEIAAMGFTQRMLELPYLPYVMDAFLVYGYSPQAASALYEEMMRFAGREARLPDLGDPIGLDE